MRLFPQGIGDLRRAQQPPKACFPDIPACSRAPNLIEAACSRWSDTILICPDAQTSVQCRNGDSCPFSHDPNLVAAAPEARAPRSTTAPPAMIVQLQPGDPLPYPSKKCQMPATPHPCFSSPFLSSLLPSATLRDSNHDLHLRPSLSRCAIDKNVTLRWKWGDRPCYGRLAVTTPLVASLFSAPGVPYVGLDVECVATTKEHNGRATAQIALVSHNEQPILNLCKIPASCAI